MKQVMAWWWREHRQVFYMLYRERRSETESAMERVNPCISNTKGKKNTHNTVHTSYESNSQALRIL